MSCGLLDVISIVIPLFSQNEFAVRTQDLCKKRGNEIGKQQVSNLKAAGYVNPLSYILDFVKNKHSKC